MSKKNRSDTKKKIVNAAWKLFYEQGYEDTTVEEIIELSQTSKGSFYHYFKSKDALLSSLSYIFDDKYIELEGEVDPKMNSFDKLMYYNFELFKMIENSVSLDLLAILYSSQLVTKGEKHLLDYNRVYYKVIRQTVIQGQEKGEIADDVTVNEVVKTYALCERALIYDWCICNGEYSLSKYSASMLPVFMASYKK